MPNLAQNFRKLSIKLTSNTLFVIEIDHTGVKHVSGELYKRFVDDCADVARDNNLKSGLIYAVKRSGGGAQLKFGGRIPDDAAQRFRNIWSFYS